MIPPEAADHVERRAAIDVIGTFAWLDPALGQAHFQENMHIVSQIVLAALRVHPSRSVGQTELASLAGCTNRQVRAAIAHLRRRGYLIMGGDGSEYHFARNVEEVHRYLAHLSSQIVQLEELRMVMDAALQRFGIGNAGYPHREVQDGTIEIAAALPRVPDSASAADSDESGQGDSV